MSEETKDPLKGLIDFAILGDWMDKQGLSPGKPIEDATVLAGGTQNVLVRFKRGDRLFVMRRPPPHLRANSNETMRREARVLAALGDTDVPHPRFIAGCGDESVMLGVAWYLMEAVDGFNPTVALPPLHAGSEQIRNRMGFALAEGIASLGAVDHVKRGLSDLGKVDGYLERQVPRWLSQLESYKAFPDWEGAQAIPGVEKVSKWLDAHRPSRFDPGIIHGDYHLANVMYRNDGGDLAAIVDWELTTIGDPLLDLGWLMATWPEEGSGVGGNIQPWTGFPTISELIAHYRARTTRDTSAIDWYGVLACFKLGIILEGSHARASAGQAPKAIGDRLHAQTISLFERAQRMIK